jgi:hypothetical protein
MKVAVYAIAKNEAQFVQRWADSCIDADYRIIMDTGSTDETLALAEQAGITVNTILVDPWRFDHARNAALALVSSEVDYCIALDMDEVLLPGWRAALEVAHAAGWTRPRYQYTWSWNDDGSPGLVYGGDKIHARNGYRWKHPVHEVITADGIQETQGWVALEIHHFPDHSKSRGQYFPLLRLAVEEDPDDDRNAYYYARELYFHNYFAEATAEFKRHLSLPRATWEPERAASMRYLAKMNPGERERWLLRAAGECPWRREAWVDLAQHYYETQQWECCFAAAIRAVSITEKPLEYICEAFAWGPAPHDYAAIAAYNLGLHDRALHHGQMAVSLDPGDERLSRNLLFYRDANLSQ